MLIEHLIFLYKLSVINMIHIVHLFHIQIIIIITALYGLIIKLKILFEKKLYRDSFTLKNTVSIEIVKIIVKIDIPTRDI